MGNTYNIDLELNKKGIKGKKDFIDFYKKILLLKSYIKKIDFKYYKDESESILGNITLDRTKFDSLYKSASIIKPKDNFEYFRKKSREYTIGFSMTRWKGNKKIRAVLEDSPKLYYKHSLPTIEILPYFIKHAKIPKFYLRYYRIIMRLSQPSFIKKLGQIDLPFITILFDPYKKINKYVEKNNEIIVEFVKKIIKLYDVKEGLGRHYSTTSGDGTIIFKFSKKSGFKTYQEML